MSTDDRLLDLCVNCGDYLVDLRSATIGLSQSGVRVRPAGRHIEAEVDLGGESERQLLLFSTHGRYLELLSDVAQRLFACVELQRECRVRSLRYREYSFRVDVLVCNIAQGELLGQYVARADGVLIKQLYDCVAMLEDQLREAEICFDTLGARDLILGDDGRLHLRSLRGWQAEGQLAPHNCCDDLRRWIATTSGVQPLVAVAQRVAKSHVQPLVEGYLWCGTPHEERIAVKGDRGCGFVDLDGCVVVEAKYSSVTSFREGRAVVESERGYGLIDLYGEFVIEDIYEDMLYDAKGGTTVAKLDGRWLKFDYCGNISISTSI